MPNNDSSLIAVGLEFLGWTSSALAEKIQISEQELNSVQDVRSPQFRKAIEQMIRGGLGHPSLMEAGRVLAGVSQERIAKQAQIATGTYRRIEQRGVLTASQAINCSATLTRILRYFLAQRIYLTTQPGPGVCKLDLLQPEMLLTPAATKPRPPKQPKLNS